VSTGTALMSIIAAGAPFLLAILVRFAVLIGGTVAAVLIALWTGEHAGITRRALRHQRRVRLATAVADVDERHWRSVQDMLAGDGHDTTQPSPAQPAGCGWCIDDDGQPPAWFGKPCTCDTTCKHPACPAPMSDPGDHR